MQKEYTCPVCGELVVIGEEYIRHYRRGEGSRDWHASCWRVMDEPPGFQADSPWLGREEGTSSLGDSL